MYIVWLIVKIIFGATAIAVYTDYPHSKYVGILSGIALGITLCQYLEQYVW